MFRRERRYATESAAYLHVLSVPRTPTDKVGDFRSDTEPNAYVYVQDADEPRKSKNCSDKEAHAYVYVNDIGTATGGPEIEANEYAFVKEDGSPDTCSSKYTASVRAVDEEHVYCLPLEGMFLISIRLYALVRFNAFGHILNPKDIGLSMAFSFLKAKVVKPN